MLKNAFRSLASSALLAGALLAPALAADFNPDIGGMALGLPIQDAQAAMSQINPDYKFRELKSGGKLRSEEHTSELQSLMRNSYAVFCLKKKINRRQAITSVNTDEQKCTH